MTPSRPDSQRGSQAPCGLERRAVEEWIGATPNTPIPPRVRLRVFRRHNGVCHISKRKIMPADKWDCDHVIAIINGGENRESNLAPAIRDKHRQKTAEDVAEKAKTDSMAKRHLGIKTRSSLTHPTKYRGVDGRVRERN